MTLALRILRIVISLLGAAAVPALAAGLYAWFVMAHGKAPPLGVAHAMLSLTFQHALVHTIWLGLPVFALLYRRRRLNGWTAAAAGAAIGVVLVHLYTIVLYGPMVLGIWLEAPLFTLLFISQYVAMGALTGLSAWFVWATFPWQAERPLLAPMPSPSAR